NQTGNYVVVTYDSIGCTGFSASYYYATTILQNEILDSDILIYPNPTSDFVSINIPAGHVGAEIIFLDITGKEVLKEKLISKSSMLSVAGIAKGVYVAIIQIEDRRFYERVVVGL
ncbi:MAG TPA: T9SS type A sorting domain-containing protein, partial [Bacteroidia bacterium]|nr:T9SS type A sorting domain-containing protein [Bacteroidia bacterium]